MKRARLCCRSGVVLLLLGLVLSVSASSVAAVGAGIGVQASAANVVPPDLGRDLIRDIALQPDGRIVAVGDSADGSWAWHDRSNDFAVARYLPDGSLDSTFGWRGKVTTPIGDRDSAREVVLQPDGKIVVAGNAVIGGTNRIAVVRYLPDGTLDTSFGTGGKVITSIGPAYAAADALVLQPDGKLVAGGTYTGQYEENGWALVRYLPDGSPDPNFGSSGTVKTRLCSIAFVCSVEDIALQPDGKLVAAGGDNNQTSDGDFVVARYLPDGSLDTSFGTGGIARTPLGSGATAPIFSVIDYAFAVAVQPDGKIVATGDGSGDFVLTRYLPDGSPDTGFGSDGVVTTPNTGRAWAMALQPDGGIVAGGGATTEPATTDFALARYLPDGSPDTSFGSGGIVTTQIGVIESGWGSSVLTVALQPDGRLVAGGGASYASSTRRFALARYLPDGSLDPSFGSDGVVTTRIVPPNTFSFPRPDKTRSSTRFYFMSNDRFLVSQFECKLDDAEWTSCTSPVTYSGLAEGSHTFQVRAISDEGWTDSTPATWTWSVDLSTPPVAKLGVTPNAVLTGDKVSLDALGSYDPVDGTIVDYRWDLGTGDFTTDTGTTHTATTRFATPGSKQVRVEVTNNIGLTAVASATVDVSLAPPPGPVGMSIDDGAYATNDPNVQLDLVWPRWEWQALVSNDGGFGSASGTQTLPIAPSLPWTLRSEGAEKLPKIVYLRFPNSDNPTITYSDDIILDQTAPTIESANGQLQAPPASAKPTLRVLLKAEDDNSGISRLQVRSGQAKPFFSRTFARPTTPGPRQAVVRAVLPRRPHLSARVYDQAGNHSRWMAVHRPQTLKVSLIGTGRGRVDSTTHGIGCGTDCSHTYVYGKTIELVAHARAGSRFAGWQGGRCSGRKPVCRVSMITARTVRAKFALG